MLRDTRTNVTESRMLLNPSTNMDQDTNGTGFIIIITFHIMENYWKTQLGNQKTGINIFIFILLTMYNVSMVLEMGEPVA